MAKGTEIVVVAEPAGRYLEGIVYGTPKPGTMMQIKDGVEPINGRFTFEVYTPGTNGDRRPVLILLPDRGQGKLETDAYVSGTRCFLYAPIAGEDINVLRKDISGTGDDFAIGALLIAESGSGKFIATTGSPESEPFQVLETVTDPTADGLVWCLYTGY